MRIVGGRLRGRRLKAPADGSTRPTIDRVRESLFNILESRYRDRLIGGQVGDLYAGTGALGIEALSRGAAHATFVEQSPAGFRILKENVRMLGLEAQATLIRGAAAEAMARLSALDILFLDPPYGGEEASRALHNITTFGCISPDGLVVLETGHRDRIEHPPALEIVNQRTYGKTTIHFMKISG